MYKETQNEAADVAYMMNEGLAKDVSEGRDVLDKQKELRGKIQSSDLLTEEDKEKWNRKLENAQNSLSESAINSLHQEFAKEQGAIKAMVDTYTRKVMESKDEAFTVDSTRGIDTAEDYLEWFESISYSEKQAALHALDADIEERKELRRNLLKRFDKKDVVKMRRSEMKDKMKELDVVEGNVATYKIMLKKDARLFHDISIYLEEFEDLTPKEQEEWMMKYEEEIAKPRKALVETHDSLPSRFRSSNFLRMPSEKKREYLEGVEDKIEREYTTKISKIPSDTWSEESKRFAMDDFMKLDSVAKKAQWLEFLPSAIRAEEKLVRDYKDSKFKKVREMPDYSTRKWERSRFEEKEQMLKAMEAEVLLLETFTSILEKSEDEKVISESTKERYMKLYNGNNLSERRMAVKTIMSAMSPRRALLQDFEKLNSETKKRFTDFYDRGYKARLEIYKEARLYEAENFDESESADKENQPESLEKSDVMKIIEKLQRQADENEQLGNLEKAIGLHEAVLALHPENELSKKKIEQLNMELDALDTASNDTILDAIEKNLQMGSAQTEIKYIKLAQEIIDDKAEVVSFAKGNENLAKQHTNLDNDSFESEVYEELVKQSGGRKIVDSDWEVQNVQRIDVGKLGIGANDPTRIAKDLNILSEQENLNNVQLANADTGKNLTLNEAKARLQKRKEALEKKVGADNKISLDERLAA